MDKLFYTSEQIDNFSPPDVMFEQTKLVDDWLAMDAEIKKTHKWISIKDELPGNYSVVLTYDGEVIIIASHFGNGDGFRNSAGFSITGVTHWMPLPHPPEDDNL